MKKSGMTLAMILIFLAVNSPAFAGYIIKLKNGRNLETSSYWEEKGEIKFQWQGGVASFPKKNVFSIVKVKEKFTERSPKVKETLPGPAAVPQKLPEILKKSDVPSPKEVEAAPAPQEITPKEMEQYKRQKAYYTEQFEQAFQRYMEATSRRDLEAKKQAREEYNEFAGKVFALEGEVTKRNNGVVPPWWKEK